MHGFTLSIGCALWGEKLSLIFKRLLQQFTKQAVAIHIPQQQCGLLTTIVLSTFFEEICVFGETFFQSMENFAYITRVFPMGCFGSFFYLTDG